MELRRGAFFDRDGVINVSPVPGQYVRSWEEFQLIPEAVEWIRLLNAMEMPVIVVTNQRGVSRGLIIPWSSRGFTRTCEPSWRGAARAWTMCTTARMRKTSATAASPVPGCSTRLRASGNWT